MKTLLMALGAMLLFLYSPAQKIPVNNIQTNKNSISVSTDAKSILQKLWKSNSFISDYRYFWLYNYGYFRIPGEKENAEMNKTPRKDGLTGFALADANPDKESRGTLYYDKDSKIFISYFQLDIRTPVKIVESMHEVFGTNDPAPLLITEKDKAFWTWNETSFYSSTFSKDIPKGVVPRFDLRTYFRDSLPGTFLVYQEEFNSKAFIKYFEQYKFESLIPADFSAFHTTDKKLLDLIDKVNAQSGKETFYLVDFNPSGYWGVVNLKVLNAAQVSV